MLMPLVSLLFAVVLLSGCATTDPLRSAEVSSVTVDVAKLQPKELRGEKVRWGGSIIGIENRRDYTLVSILSRPLTSSGEPDDRKQGLGRFIAKMSGFVDPADYKQPNRMTVVGELQGAVEKRVGDYPYTYPLVTVEHHRLWVGNKEDPPPAYYDPWWGSPWGPWGPWPYHRYPYW